MASKCSLMHEAFRSRKFAGFYIRQKSYSVVPPQSVAHSTISYCDESPNLITQSEDLGFFRSYGGVYFHFGDVGGCSLGSSF